MPRATPNVKAKVTVMENAGTANEKQTVHEIVLPRADTSLQHDVTVLNL